MREYFSRQVGTYEVTITSVEAPLAHFWCPFCGGWHGSSPPPRVENTEAPAAPPIPKVLREIIATEVSRPSMFTKERGTVNREPAKVRINTETGKMDVYWGGDRDPDGEGHGHIVSHDGLNADYVREPGPERNDIPVNNNLQDPYANPGMPQQDTLGRYDFS